MEQKKIDLDSIFSDTDKMEIDLFLKSLQDNLELELSEDVCSLLK